LSWKDNPNDGAVNADSVACIAALSEFKFGILDDLKSSIFSGYNVDPFCVSLKSVLPLWDDCTLVDGLIVIDNQLLVPATGNLRMRLMDARPITDLGIWAT
jgi:hypothetical protein